MTLGERIDLAREALAQGLAPLPIVPDLTGIHPLR